jgi:hypothetical protein
MAVRILMSRALESRSSAPPVEASWEPGQADGADLQPASPTSAMAGLVLVPMTLVGRVPVSVVHVIDVVTVGDALMATARTVLVRMILVDDVGARAALVPVALVKMVDVAVVKVVHMVAVLYRSVTAIRSMLMGMVLVYLVFACHGADGTI